ncbi:DUF3426 domain-containing protein [Endozoicomonas lisbonensis]|uniref:Zn finger-like uncharacterized protein n=1 Tax=Endozoicomonas lisbonensis TaxID=3120522 RepID=A0ABV2SG96_9GAMM
MTPSRVNTTRCPKCQTSFRVTQAQLRAAGGSVRCGSCLHVFNAGTDSPEDTISPSEQQAGAAPPEIQSPEQLSEKTTPESSLTSPAINSQSSQSQPLSSLLNNLDKEQVDIRQEKRPRRPETSKKRMIQYIVAFAACLTLGTQYLWFNKNELSLDPSFRPWYQWLCQTLNCTLPPVVDINEIQSSQLLVRIHPDISEIMMVDAVIINKADHPQPWPKLSLTFSNLHDQPVASRTFSPKEYLGGELAGTKEMPANQAIRLSLELLDPGQDAVNYRLTFKNKTP